MTVYNWARLYLPGKKTLIISVEYFLDAAELIITKTQHALISGTPP